MATGDSYKSLSEMFEVPTSTVCNIIHRVLLCVNSIRRDINNSPRNLEEVREISNGFRKICKEIVFCAGALDGTNIQFEAPDKKYGPRYYIDLRRNYSINTQAICDTKHRFFYAYKGELLSEKYWKVLFIENLSINSSEAKFKNLRQQNDEGVISIEELPNK